MFVAINNLRAKANRGDELEARFAEPRGLDEQPGFIGFELLKRSWAPGDDDDSGEIHYKVVTRWTSMKDFLGWTKSDAFKEAHAGGRPDFLAGGGHPAGYKVALHRKGNVEAE